jgi:hypothetical protein
MTHPPHPSPRLDRERRTVGLMIGMYCRAHHSPVDGLCPECADLQIYALQRIDRCRFGTEKPTCANCPVHCYKPDQRERIRQVMRYAGPRMLFSHPLLTVWHLLDGRRKTGAK